MLGRFTPGVCNQVVAVVNHQQNRNMATLKSIQLRLKSVKNIQKITQSMKMVSAAKYARAERDLKAARPYGEGAVQFYERAEVAPPEDDPKELYIAVTSDRGLCGACHTGVAKAIRTRLNEPGSENIKVVCIGDKSRAVLQRLYRNHIICVANEIGRLPPSFGDASKLAAAVLECGYEYASGKIFYNQFKSVVSYQQSDLPVFSRKAVESAPKMATYDSLDADVIQSYMEFSMASMLFYALKEGACSEQSARMTAMDNASKNAGEMIDKLTLTFNRTRQAVITRELIEIISGAAALD
ncbi:ATP synthase subunit gamma, mitochondrial [Hyposmocoma kahamanoa]|uniref:ATP synthase subunit gamma, mitochondrial n=1 Tax=Hyposmocoma kahamanoa TaxID=1477025 RepID=UPI000E6D6C83|nr:ATP synthase subunit gamma, mitochondrial [Hyposmocoma kahamanoa]XP_026315911.1 ATP synthase subunit gamma, mitochondrial [Hyposmocoma kahamanoa]